MWSIVWIDQCRVRCGSEFAFGMKRGATSSTAARLHTHTHTLKQLAEFLSLSLACWRHFRIFKARLKTWPKLNELTGREAVGLGAGTQVQDNRSVGGDGRRRTESQTSYRWMTIEQMDVLHSQTLSTDLMRLESERDSKGQARRSRTRSRTRRTRSDSFVSSCEKWLCMRQRKNKIKQKG